MALKVIKDNTADPSTTSKSTKIKRSSSSSNSSTNGNGPSAIYRLFRSMISPISSKKTEDSPAAATAKSATATSATAGELERVFRYFDENGDGKISASELRNGLSATSGDEVSLEAAEAAVELTDSDGDGELGLDDFIKLVEAEGEEEKARNLKDAFHLYEMDGWGCITAQSLRQMLSRLGDDRTVEECAAMIRRFDLNGDGVLSFDEFKTMMA